MMLAGRVFGSHNRKERLQKIEDYICFNASTNKFGCGVCNKEFTRKDSLQNHFETFHMTSEGYTCDFCGRNFISLNHLRVHKHKLHRSV